MTLISTDSDSDSSSSEEENLYYSTYDNKIKKGLAAKPLPEKKDEHNFCLTLKVGKGLLTIYAPVRVSFILPILLFQRLQKSKTFDVPSLSEQHHASQKLADFTTERYLSQNKSK